jgi:hypothetical protein
MPLARRFCAQRHISRSWHTQGFHRFCETSNESWTEPHPPQADRRSGGAFMYASPVNVTKVLSMRHR